VRAAPDIEAWLDDLARLRADGVEHPLALGGPATQFQLFEAVLIADLGGPGYRDLWHYADGWSSPDLDVAIDHFGRLLDFTDLRMRSLTPTQVAERIVAGESGYAVLADSSLAVFEADGFADGAFRSAAAPGTAGVFDLRADAFALTAGAGHQDAALAWLRVVASAEGQAAFAAPKGALPARIGSGAELTSSYQIDANLALTLDQVVPSLSAGIAAPPAWSAEVRAAVERFVRDRRGGPLRTSLLSAAAEHLND
jgi:glucose/mannose transport system substrate-binding protein